MISHISFFVQDNMTIAGESAGAVYAHAHMFSTQKIKRGILQSGSLHLSPPLPIEKGSAMIDAIARDLLKISGESLKDASVETMLRVLQNKESSRCGFRLKSG
jgi:carboxylesterase type B